MQRNDNLTSFQAYRTDRLSSIEELRAVHRASIRLQAANEPQELAAETIRVLEDTLGYELCAVLLIDGPSGLLTPFALSDQQQGQGFVERDREKILSYEVRLGHGITGWVAANGQTVRSGNVSEDPRYLGIRHGIASELCVPMRVRGNVVGVVNVETSRPNAYTESDERVLEIIASQIAIAIENNRLQQALVHSQRLDAIGQLTSGIAHDFNNILTVINGYAGLVLARDDISRDVREAIEQIKLAGDQSTKMIRHLLAFGRKTVLRAVVRDPNEEIARLTTMLERLLGPEIRLSVKGGHVGKVEVDPTQFGQVMINLAVNAREAMPDGGEFSIVTATVEITTQSRPELPTLAQGRYVEITVTDTGHGMDELTSRSLFEPYFSTKTGGSGLGLAMAYGVIRQSGGNIKVESRPGRGARFTILLPIVERPEAAESSPDDRAAAPASGRILVVDDDEAVRFLVGRLLERAGHCVVCAESGPEAIAIASREDAVFDVVVSDVVMPVMDGPTLVKAVRKQQPDIRVLYMSAYPARNLDERGKFVEADHLLAKPFTQDTLIRKISELLVQGVVQGVGPR